MFVFPYRQYRTCRNIGGSPGDVGNKSSTHGKQNKFSEKKWPAVGNRTQNLLWDVFLIVLTWYLPSMGHVQSHLKTRKSSCVNARGIPTAAYQVLHLLPYPGGYLHWRGVPTFHREGGGTYLQGPHGGYLHWIGWGVATMEVGPPVVDRLKTVCSRTTYAVGNNDRCTNRIQEVLSLFVIYIWG